MTEPVAAKVPRGKRRRSIALTLIAVWLVAVGVIAFVLLSPFSRASTNGIDQSALAYGRNHMVWSQGPTVQSTRVIRLRELPAALGATVASHVAQDVNVPQLERRFGANREVALVVLHGVYNSLPPDEGVIIAGQAVVLLDPHTDKELYIND